MASMLCKSGCSFPMAKNSVHGGQYMPKPESRLNLIIQMKNWG